MNEIEYQFHLWSAILLVTNKDLLFRFGIAVFILSLPFSYDSFSRCFYFSFLHFDLGR